MDTGEIEYRIKRLEYAMIEIALWGMMKGLYLGICMNSAVDNVPPPHWLPMPQIDWTRNPLGLDGEYNKQNYPMDFREE